MTPSKHRTPTSFRDGLQGECIAMPFAQDQMVESCHFIKQFDSQAKCVLAGGDVRLRAGSAPAPLRPRALCHIRFHVCPYSQLIQTSRAAADRSCWC